MTHHQLAFHLARGEQFDVRSFEVKDSISSLFSVTLAVMSTGPDLDLEEYVGERASFVLGGRRTWTGIIRSFALEQSEPSGLSLYRLELVPHCWLLTQRRNSRIFQHLSEIEIILSLLAEWAVPVELRIDPLAYKKREIRVQYEETDFSFVSRLLEDAGVSYWIQVTPDEERMVLCDAPEQGAPRDPLPLIENPSMIPESDYVSRFSAERELRPTAYTVRDVDTRLPSDLRLLSTHRVPGKQAEAALESFHYVPGAFLYEGDAESNALADGKFVARTNDTEAVRLAKRRLDAQRGPARSYRFTTTALDLKPGDCVPVARQPDHLEVGQPLLVIATKLKGEATGTWEMACVARRTDAAFRPPFITPKPRTSGVELGTVVGLKGEEIYVDEFGRVKVHFHWDRLSQLNEDSSCWVPVSQPWAGTGFGGVNIPRIGQEVIVDFLGGDPDRPIIVGRTFTAAQAVPFKLPENKTQSGWRSNSTTRTGGYNEIMFEDLATRELFRVQAERDMHRLVKHDEETKVGNDRIVQVVHDESTSVGNDRTLLVGGTERISIGVNQSTVVGANRTTMIGGSDTTQVGDTHLVQIAPAGAADATSASSTMSDKRIVLDTGAGATITMEGNRIRIEADVIEIVARDYIDLQGRKKGIGLGSPNGKNVFTGPSFSVSCNEIEIGGTTVKIGASGGMDLAGSPITLNGPGMPAGRVGDAVGGTILQGAATVLIGGASSAIGPFDSIEDARRQAEAAAKRKGLESPLDEHGNHDWDFEWASMIYSDPVTGRFYVTEAIRFDYHDPAKPGDDYNQPAHEAFELPKGAEPEGRGYYSHRADDGDRPPDNYSSIRENGFDAQGVRVPRYDAQGRLIRR